MQRNTECNEQDTPQTVECSKDDKQAQPLTDKAA